jgi:hypothetical protein
MLYRLPDLVLAPQQPSLVKLRCLDNDLPAVRHHVARVYSQIKQHRFTVERIVLLKPKITNGCHFQRDCGADGASGRKHLHSQNLDTSNTNSIQQSFKV